MGEEGKHAMTIRKVAIVQGNNVYLKCIDALRRVHDSESDTKGSLSKLRVVPCRNNGCRDESRAEF
jgi:hypothetical protein